MAGTRSQRQTTTDRHPGLIRPGFSAGQAPTVEIQVRTAYDFLIAACGECGELSELLPQDRDWLVKIRTTLGADPSPCPDSCSAITTELVRILVEKPEVKTARDLVTVVDEMADAALLECLFGEVLEMPEVGQIARLALDGDKAAYAELQNHLEHFKGSPVLTVPLAEIAPNARRILHAWLPYYEGIEGRMDEILRRDAASRRLQDAAADPLGFVERVTNGVRTVPEARIRRIVLSPTYFGRPYNSLSRIGEVQFIGYPVADASLEAAGGPTPPAATIRLYRALGDETRLRILRLLADRDRYLTELANELELSKPTMSHHLAQLRAAGLVTITEQGNLTYYTLRRDRASEAGVELTSFLAH
jgi:DNA-binding transcriptional ArsR family regulator